MADDKRKKKQDAKLVAAGESYEVAYFAKKWGLSADDARSIIEAHGPSRKACDAAAAALNGASDIEAGSESSDSEQT